MRGPCLPALWPRTQRDAVATLRGYSGFPGGGACGEEPRPPASGQAGVASWRRRLLQPPSNLQMTATPSDGLAAAAGEKLCHTTSWAPDLRPGLTSTSRGLLICISDFWLALT